MARSTVFKPEDFDGIIPIDVQRALQESWGWVELSRNEQFIEMGTECTGLPPVGPIQTELDCTYRRVYIPSQSHFRDYLHRLAEVVNIAAGIHDVFPLDILKTIWQQRDDRQHKHDQQ